MSGMIHLTNFQPQPIVDGGSHREEALADFLASRGARRLVVQDSVFGSSKWQRVARLSRLKREMREAAPDLVVLNYPACPFLWQHKVGYYFASSVVLLRWLRHEATRRGFKIVIDVMDLPVFQHRDLGYELQMRDSTLARFDRFVFGQADAIWVCSGLIAGLIHEHYGVPEARLITALNGHKMGSVPLRDTHEGVRFAYAGSMNSERGIAPAIEAFLAGAAPDSELHLCGPFGDWIPGRFDDPRIVYHGALTDADACAALAACDVGLIPYPERGYYHVAFATKLPFYLNLGLPVLCSAARETASYVEKLGIGMWRDIDSFATAFSEISRNPGVVDEWRGNVLAAREEFDWSYIYSRALAETPGGERM